MNNTAFHRLLASGKKPWRLRRRLRNGLVATIRWALGSTNRVMSEDDLAGSRARSLLFLQYEIALGTAINATPVFEAVKRIMPRSFITVATAGLPYEILKYNPFIDRILKTPNPHQSLASAAFRILMSVRAKYQFDCVVTDTGNQKARIALLAILSGAKQRIGFTAAPELYHTPLQREPSLSILRDNLRLTAALGQECLPTEPRVFFSQREVGIAEALLAQAGVTDTRRRVILVTQTSGGQPSRWRDDRFAAVADYLSTQFEAAILFVGTAKETAAIDDIRHMMACESVNIAGKTDIPTLAALLSQSDLVVSLDTGTMHLARAVGAPTVIIAPAWQPAHEWLPLDAPNCFIIRRNDIPCAGCRKFVCSTRECMEEIFPEEVIAAIGSLWKTYPPSLAGRHQRASQSLVDTSVKGP